MTPRMVRASLLIAAITSIALPAASEPAPTRPLCTDVSPHDPGIAAVPSLLNPGEPPPPLGPDAPRPPALRCAMLPAAGSAQQFVPTGWQQVSQASGDLSGDGVADTALLICPALAVRQIAWESQYFSCGACVPSGFSCAALVLAGQPDGFALWAVETALDVSAERTLRFTIDKAILSLHIQQDGHYASYDTLLKYRARGDALRLIGTERHFQSEPAEEEYVSTNWLTRARKQRDCSWGECSRWKSSRTPAGIIRFGDGSLSKGQEG
jgi:hypothetical protein